MAEETLLKRYGWVVSINPLGQMIAAPLFGYLYQKTGSARLVGLITSVAYILGNILYAILSVFPQDYRYGLMLLSRFIVGASAGTKCLIIYSCGNARNSSCSLASALFMWDTVVVFCVQL